LFHPTTGSWVRRVSSSLQRVRSKPSVLHARLSLRRRHPSKSSPRRQPYRVTAASCLLAVAFHSGTPAPAAALRSDRRVSPTLRMRSAYGTLQSRTPRTRRPWDEPKSSISNRSSDTLCTRTANCPNTPGSAVPPKRHLATCDIGIRKPLSRQTSFPRRDATLSCALFHTPRNKQRQAIPRRLTPCFSTFCNPRGIALGRASPSLESTKRKPRDRSQYRSRRGRPKPTSPNPILA